MRVFSKKFLASLKESLPDSLVKKGLSMLIWRIASLCLTFATTVWIARSLGPKELGKSGLVMAVSVQVLLVISVCPGIFAVRKYKEAVNPDEILGLVYTARTIMGGLYAVSMFLLFMFDVIPVNWENITILGAFIPVILSAQPLWIFQARSASRRMRIFCSVVYRFDFIVWVFIGAQTNFSSGPVFVISTRIFMANLQHLNVK